MNTFGIKTLICKSFKFGTFMNSSELACFGQNKNSFLRFMRVFPIYTLGNLRMHFCMQSVSKGAIPSEPEFKHIYQTLISVIVGVKLC